MPIEIRELMITATVNDQSQNSSVSAPDLKTLKKQIISECIEEVVRIMNEKKQR